MYLIVVNANISSNMTFTPIVILVKLTQVPWTYNIRFNVQIDAHVDTLVSEQAAYILNRANLAEIYSTVQQHQPKHGPLSNLPGMDSISVKSSMVIFIFYLKLDCPGSGEHRSLFIYVCKIRSIDLTV